MVVFIPIPSYLTGFIGAYLSLETSVRPWWYLGLLALKVLNITYLGALSSKSVALALTESMETYFLKIPALNLASFKSIGASRAI